MGAFAYAEDIKVLAPTKSAMYKVLHIAKKESSKEYSLTLNQAKSVLTVYILGGFE